MARMDRMRFSRVSALDLSSAPVVTLPVRGEWVAVNTPAERVPSHGTNYFGQRYAFDFARLDEGGQKFYPNSVLRHFLAVVGANEFLAWNAPVLASFGGRVIEARDGWLDRLRVNAIWELVRATFLAQGPDGADYRRLVGNYVMVQGNPGVALYAHLRKESITVRGHDNVTAGQELGRVGNSGNSTMPHLHFHLMSGTDPLTAEGRLCAFTGYERRVGANWVPVGVGVPGPLERVRAV